MGWRRDLKIWAVSCAVAVSAGVGIGLVSVALTRSYAAPAAAAETLPVPGESQQGGSSSPAGPSTSAGTSTSRADGSAGGAHATEVAAGVSATRRSDPAKGHPPAGPGAKPKPVKPHDKDDATSGRTKPKPAKPVKEKPGK